MASGVLALVLLGTKFTIAALFSSNESYTQLSHKRCLGIGRRLDQLTRHAGYGALSLPFVNYKY